MCKAEKVRVLLSSSIGLPNLVYMCHASNESRFHKLHKSLLGYILILICITTNSNIHFQKLKLWYSAGNSYHESGFQQSTKMRNSDQKRNY